MYALWTLTLHNLLLSQSFGSSSGSLNNQFLTIFHNVCVEKLQTRDLEPICPLSQLVCKSFEIGFCQGLGDSFCQEVCFLVRGGGVLYPRVYVWCWVCLVLS